MGKCLSCCPATHSVITQTCDEKFSDIVRKSDSTEQQQPGGSNTEQLCRCEKGLLESFSNSTANSNAATENNKNLSLTEKLILPILGSAVCIENKRSSHSSREYSESKISNLFEHYKDPNENAILSEGIERFCQDLGVSPDDFRILLLAWKFEAQQMFCFTKDEFFRGCRSLKADSVQVITGRFSDLLNEVKCPEKFRDLYRFTFRFGLEPNQRVLMSEMAIQLWRLVFYGNEPPILRRWLGFLEKHPGIRGISKDTWDMFFNFAESVGNDLSSYDDTAAWPSLFDDFVEYENDQTNQNTVPSKEKSIVDV